MNHTLSPDLKLFQKFPLEVFHANFRPGYPLLLGEGSKSCFRNESTRLQGGHIKKRALTIISLCFAVILLATAFVLAQIKAQGMTVDVPFSFALSNRTMPAGTHLVTQVSPGSLMAHNFHGEAGVVVSARPAGKVEKSHKAGLIFHCYGDQYFLAKAWADDKTDSIEFYPFKSKRELIAVRTNTGPKSNNVYEEIFIAAKQGAPKSSTGDRD
jgi:hypothetical protein